jgi:uncharacterized protein (DUF427 family)
MLGGLRRASRSPARVSLIGHHAAQPQDAAHCRHGRTGAPAGSRLRGGPARGRYNSCALRLGEAHYPYFYLPLADVAEDAINGLAGHVKIEWDAIDEWYEEDEQVFVHPRNPYTRVDALRSSRLVRVELSGVVLAESASTVMVHETGLPTRYYFELTAVRFEHLVPSDEVTACPYKGNTSGAAVADRRAGVVLQREGRRLHRRRGARAAGHALLPVRLLTNR